MANIFSNSVEYSQFSNSSFERDQLVSYYGADPSRVEIVPPGVDHSIFNPASKKEAREILNLNEQKTLLFVGRIQPLKGVDLAVSTLSPEPIGAIAATSIKTPDNALASPVSSPSPTISSMLFTPLSKSSKIDLLFEI